jgi:hypothetical protein
VTGLPLKSVSLVSTLIITGGGLVAQAEGIVTVSLTALGFAGPAAITTGMDANDFLPHWSVTIHVIIQFVLMDTVGAVKVGWVVV